MAKRNLIIIILLIIIIMAAAFAGFSGYKFFKQWQATKRLESGIQGPYPKDAKIVENAIQQKDASLCEQVKEISKDDCLFDLASVYNESQYCQPIQDASLLQKCNDLVSYRFAIDANDIDACLKVQTIGFQGQCLSEIFRKQNDLAFCQNLSAENKTLCADIINANLALAQKDIKICEQIKDNYLKNNCLSAVSNLPKDSDNDGVTDMQERSYGTNPFKADSDADGRSDLKEIEAGTNPVKKD